MLFEYYYQLLNDERTLQPALRCPQREETVLGAFFPFVQLLKIEKKTTVLEIFCNGDLWAKVDCRVQSPKIIHHIFFLLVLETHLLSWMAQLANKARYSESEPCLLILLFSIIKFHYKKYECSKKSCCHFSNYFHEEGTLCNRGCNAKVAHEIIFFSSNLRLRYLGFICQNIHHN